MQRDVSKPVILVMMQQREHCIVIAYADDTMKTTKNNFKKTSKILVKLSGTHYSKYSLCD